MSRLVLLLCTLSAICQLGRCAKTTNSFVAIGADSYCAASITSTQFEIGALMNRLFVAETALNATEKIRQDNRQEFQKIGSRFFYIENQLTLNWLAAGHFCRRMNGVLATPLDVREWALLTTRLTVGHNYWLGISDLGKRSDYISETTGKTTTFTKFWTGEPNFYRQEEHCIELRSNQNFFMNDANCQGKSFFICEARD